MGKATRWLKGLLGIKKEKDPSGNLNSNSTAVVGDKKEKKRWSFAKSGRDSGQIQPPVEATWFRSYISDSEKEQNRHAIAVAAATAAAADAAVAAAQAAVAVVRLTSQGRGSVSVTGRDRWAAVKIQTVFRGYLVSKNSFFFFAVHNQTGIIDTFLLMFRLERRFELSKGSLNCRPWLEDFS